MRRITYDGTSGREVGVTLRLVRHERDPGVTDDLHRRHDVFGPRALLADRDGALLEVVDPLGAAHLGQLRSDLRRALAVFGLYLRLVGLGKARGRATEGEHEMRRHALLDERLARLVDDVQPAEQCLR